jgi:hypothetical protein
MAFTIPKPNLLIPKVPGVLVLGLMAAQFLIFGGNSSEEPHCTLSVEQPHLSTSLQESRGIDAIKLNITSTCNVPQKYTIIQADIQTIKNNAQITAHKFNQEQSQSSLKDPNKAVFLGLFINCVSSQPILYLGRATGKVYLASGKTISVKGDSRKFNSESCRIGAK